MNNRKITDTQKLQIAREAYHSKNTSEVASKYKQKVQQVNKWLEEYNNLFIQESKQQEENTNFHRKSLFPQWLLERRLKHILQQCSGNNEKISEFVYYYIDKQFEEFQTFKFILDEQIVEEISDRKCVLCKNVDLQISQKLPKAIYDPIYINQTFVTDFQLIFHIVNSHSENNISFEINQNRRQLSIKITKRSIEKEDLYNVQGLCIEEVPLQNKKQISKFNNKEPGINIFKRKQNKNNNNSNINNQGDIQLLKSLMDDIQFNNNYAKDINLGDDKSEIKIDREQFKQSMMQRKIYHSKFYDPIKPEELSSESEYEDDNDQLITHLEKKELESKEEIFPLEQEFYKLWNSYIQKKELNEKNSLKSELNLRNFPTTLGDFVQNNMDKLQDRLYKQFFEFLCTLLSQGLIDQQQFATQIFLVKK